MHPSSQKLERLRLAKLIAATCFVASSAAYAAEPAPVADLIFAAKASDMCQDDRAFDIAKRVAAAADAAQVAEVVFPRKSPDVCLDTQAVDIVKLVVTAPPTATPASAGSDWELVAAAEPDEPAAAELAALPSEPPKKEFFGGKFSFITKIPANFAQRTATLSEHISDKFKVDPAVSDRVAASALRMGWAAKVPPSLILAIISVESGFKAEAKNGNATGLMQIIPFWHKEKVEAVGGTSQLAKIENNIAAGTKILKEYIERSRGNIFNAVYRYNASSHANAYAKKVLTEQQKFESVMKADDTMKLE